MGLQERNKQVAEMENWPRTVSLTLSDRLWLFALLPKEGDISNLRLLRELKELLNTNDEENDKYAVKAIQGGIQVDPKWLEPKLLQETARSFSIGRKAWEIAKETLVRLSTQKKLQIDCIELYEKFTDEARYASKPHGDNRLDPESSISDIEERDRAVKPVSAKAIARAAGTEE